MKKFLVIYHNEDNDGLFSAALFRDYIINTLHCKLDDIKFLGSNYNSLEVFANENDPEQLHEQYENIIMTDISFKDVYMKKLFKEFGNNFTWCDHHAPIIKASFKNKFDDIPGVRDTKRSAILCVWKHLYDQFDEFYNERKNPQIPRLLRILSAYDSWTYEIEGYEFEYVRNINKGVTYRYDLQLDTITSLVTNLREVYLNNQPSGVFSAVLRDNSLIKEMYDLGKSLNDYDDKTMADIIRVSGDCSWQIRIDDKDKGRPLYLKACAIFHEGATNSTMFKSLKNRVVSQGIVFKHQKNGNWVMSLYNVTDDEWLHCGEFLKERYGGGGHKGAAGCTLTEEQFINILKVKTI